MSAATDYMETNVLNYALTTNALTGTNARPTAWWVALFTTATTDAGGGTECTGTNYARQSVTFSVTADTASSTSTINFPAAGNTWGTITHLAIMSASSGGTMLFHGAVNSSKLIETGDIFQITSGQLTVTLA